VTAFPFELGLNSFGDVPTENGRTLSDAETVRLLIDEAQLAESVGLDVFSIGEHYREGFVDSAGAVLLAGIASATTTIKLGTAVTVLSTNDPVRLYNEFSTLDAISNGRAQLVLGRASQTQSFPLFGYDLADYEELFEEKLELFVALLEQEPVTWSGKTRAPLREQSVYPRVEHGKLKTWVGVGGSPESVVRTARYGLPMMLAVIGGGPLRFAPFVDLYHRALAQFQLPTQPVGMHSPAHIAETDELAQEQLWPHYRAMMDRIGRERGWSPMTRGHFEQEAGPEGALFVGSPETVARKVATAVDGLGLSRVDLKISNGSLSHEHLMDSIGLYGSAVVPRVRELLTESSTA